MNPQEEKSSEKTAELSREIGELKEKRKAVILAHYYQNPEVKEVADFVGDSLELARRAAATEAEVIVFCGVYFMAESAKILSPNKIVLLPDKSAGCRLADMATPEAVRAKKEEIPGCLVVTYVNSSAAVKAESDICCTSANAVKIVSSLPADRPVLFVPDRNLGKFVARQTGRQLVLWDGYCPVHEGLTLDQLESARRQHPDAAVVVHPECRPEITEIADCVASTGGMVRFARESPASSLIIGTEVGMLYSLEKACPGKSFYPASTKMVCEDMKLITLEKVKWALENLEFQVEVPSEVISRAQRALARMLEVS